VAPQKGAGLIERDHQATLVAVGLLALGAFFFSVIPAAALARHHASSPTPPTPATPPTPSAATTPIAPLTPATVASDDVPVTTGTVTVANDGVETRYVTSALNVGAFLQEQHIALRPGDKLSVAPEDLIFDGMTITRENAGALARRAAALHAAHIRIALAAKRKLAVHLASLRITGSLRAALAARLVRPVGTAVAGEYLAFAEMARRGFDSTLRAADTMLRMVATAYTASCYGCSGITALGYHAGHGIVAVDPRVIPLGTHLFIPGYGPAIAGDTGGAIKGSRIDLGFNSFSDALQFGRREITVYVLNTRAAARH
jgi:3D (Asp-Asp-Asp) domain-containing protein